VGGQRHAPAALPPGKNPVPIVQEAGWAPGPVWTGAENIAFTGIRSPDRQSRRELLYRLSYRGPLSFWVNNRKYKTYSAIICAGVTVYRWHNGRYRGWSCLRMGCWGTYWGLEGGEQITGEWGRSHNEKLHELYCPQNVTCVIKWKMNEMGGSCGTHGGKKEKKQNFLWINLRMKTLLGSPKHRREDNIKVDIK